MSLYKRVMHFQKWSGFFGPPCILAPINKFWCQIFPCKWMKACMNTRNTQHFTEVGNKPGITSDKVHFFWKGIISLPRVHPKL